MTKKKVDNKEDVLKFELKGVLLQSYELKFPEALPVANQKHKFDIRVQHKISAPDGLLIVETMVVISNEDNSVIQGNVRTSCVFYAEEVKKMTSIENVKISENLINTLTSISISTTRGVMFSLFRGTILQNALLPIVDPSKFTIENLE